MLFTPWNYAWSESCTKKTVLCNRSLKKKTKPSLAVRNMQIAINQIAWLPYKYLMVLCCGLKVSGRLVWSFSRRSEIAWHHPTRRVEYLLTSCLFIITKNEDVRWSGWGTWRALPCPLLFYFLCRKEEGLLVSLMVFWTCVWFRQNPQLCHWWS